MNRRIVGANDRVRLGFIGVANRGGQLISAFLKHDDMEIVALCDVQRSTLDKANARLDGKADTYGDFRELLDRKDVDAVVIATPDHWHAIQTITACDAGKDVYVEKPLSITIREGRRMIEAARRNQSVVTVGLHRRSSKLYAEAAGLVSSDGLGKVTVCRAYHRSNMVPAGISYVTRSVSGIVRSSSTAKRPPIAAIDAGATSPVIHRMQSKKWTPLLAVCDE